MLFVAASDGAEPADHVGPSPALAQWRPERLEVLPGQTFPVIGGDDVRPLVPDLDLWDCWPLAHEDGRTVEWAGRRYWFFLSAPRYPDPALRHAHARIRLLSQGEDGWRDHGHALPDGLSPGSREWAGSAVLAADGVTVTLYYTVVGRAGEAALTFEQRLFAVTGRMGPDGPTAWGAPEEIVQADGQVYRIADDKVEHAPGTLNAFRDPFFFHDPQTGADHLIFTASAGWSADRHAGVVGVATRGPSGWVLERPLVDAVGVNHELERAQVQYRDGRYYVLWSTQRHTFAQARIAGPNGLYGMVANRLVGPWRPLGGSGLVAANPEAEPRQSYSWIVTGEDEVWSFVDHWGLAGRCPHTSPELARSSFGGTVAPVVRLMFGEDRVTLAGS